MSIFHFKQAGVFHLQRIQYMVLAKSGHRYKLNDQQALTCLIKKAFSYQKDEKLKQEFALFYQNCWPITQQFIAKEVLSNDLKLIAL